jgi:hypothetical protein
MRGRRFGGSRFGGLGGRMRGAGGGFRYATMMQPGAGVPCGVPHGDSASPDGCRHFLGWQPNTNVAMMVFGVFDGPDSRFSTGRRPGHGPVRGHAAGPPAGDGGET